MCMVGLIPTAFPSSSPFRAYLLQNLNEEGSTEKPSQEKLHGFAAVLAIGSSRCKANTLGPTLVQNLPSSVQSVCESWNNINTNEFPNIGSWVSPFGIQR